ncbi:MAG: hypothetical protein RL134_1036 [Actinomycetota bacterium]|jgi:hypothetical protein
MDFSNQNAEDILKSVAVLLRGLTALHDKLHPVLRNEALGYLEGQIEALRAQCDNLTSVARAMGGPGTAGNWG